MIHGKQVFLRALEPDDADSYFQWINDPETNEMRGLYHPTSRDQSIEWVRDQSKSKADALTLAIEIPIHEGGRTEIGFIGLRSVCARSRRAELWIYLGDKSRWGKGYGEDAVHALCRYAFFEMNLFRIWMECDPEHTRAVHCYEKVGFQKEGILRKAYFRRGQFRDTCIMGLLRDEFKD